MRTRVWTPGVMGGIIGLVAFAALLGVGRFGLDQGGALAKVKSPQARAQQEHAGRVIFGAAGVLALLAGFGTALVVRTNRTRLRQAVTSVGDLSYRTASLQEDLEQREQTVISAMEARGAFLASMVTELVQPLRHTAQIAHRLLLQSDPCVQRQVSEICERVEGMRDLIEQAHQLSLLEANKVALDAVPVTPAEVLKQSLASQLKQERWAGRQVHLKQARELDELYWLPSDRFRDLLDAVLAASLSTSRSDVHLEISVGNRSGVRWMTLVAKGIESPWYGRNELAAAFEAGGLGELSAYDSLRVMVARRVAQVLGGALAFEMRERDIEWRIDLPLPSVNQVAA